ncbi:MAG: hypothetical protein ABEH86_08490 [Haloarcula sp.]
MRPLPVLIAALLLVIPLATPVAGYTAPVSMQTADGSDQLPQITAVDNTTNHLSVPENEVESTAYNQSTLDVGVAVAAGSRELRGSHAVSNFEQQFFRRDSDAARDQLVDETLADIEAQRIQLERRNERAIQQYSDGQITAEEFLQRRALIDTASRELTDRIDRIRTAAGTAPDYSLSQEQRFHLENNRGTLKTYRGPISRSITAETAGTAETNTVYLEASSSGFMLSTVIDSQYTRETYLGDERQVTAVDQFADTDDPLGAVNTRAESLYPWLYSEQYPSVQAYGSTSIYQIQADHSNGELTAYFDGGTTDVFYETQHLELTTVERSEVESQMNQSTRVRVQRSFDSGPLLLSVTDNETKIPVDASVSINGKRVGTTGSDGILWSVEPRGDYTVTVTTQDGERVTVPVSGSE